MMYILIITLVLNITLAVAAIIGAWKDWKAEEAPYGSQFRIVELKNGLYEVQQFRCMWDGLSSLKEWARPEDDRMNTFHTLDEARAYKARLVEKQAEGDGFNIKRVVE